MSLCQARLTKNGRVKNKQEVDVNVKWKIYKVRHLFSSRNIRCLRDEETAPRRV